MVKMIRSSDPSRGWDFWNWPLHAKFALGLTDPKKQVSCIDQWDDLFSMGKIGRGTPSYNVVLWIWWNWRFVDPIYRLGIMASWNWLPKGIYRLWHHLVLGPQTEPEQHTSVTWAWEGVLRHWKWDKVIGSFPWLIFFKLTVACEICIRSDWTKKLVSCFNQWDDLPSMGKLGRGIPSYNAMILIWWNFPVVDMSNHLGIMVSWNSPLKGIYGHLHQLVLGPQTKLKQHKVVPWSWEAIFKHGKDDKVIWSFPWLRFLKMTPSCEICLRSH